MKTFGKSYLTVLASLVACLGLANTPALADNTNSTNLTQNKNILPTQPNISIKPDLKATSPAIRPVTFSNPIDASTVKLAPVQFLERNIKENPASLDPDTMSDSNSIKVTRDLYDTLVRQLPTGEYVGVAAKSYSVSPDGLTWTFNLRPEAVWSDGKQVHAQDFAYAWQRLTNPKTGSAYADYLATAHVVNAKEIAKGEMDPSKLGVEAKDDLTFVVHLTQATPWFPQLVALGVLAPVRQDVVEKYGDQWTRPEHIVTNGPYLLTENVINGHMRFKKFDKYWDAKNVHITDSTEIFVTDINSVYNKYLANELLTADIPPHLWAKVLKERPGEVKEYIDPLVWSVDFNVQRVPDANVRRALKLLVDTRFLTNKILKAGRATSIFAPTFMQDAQAANEESYFYRDYRDNVAEAKKLLRAAGYTPEHPFVLKLTTIREQLMNQMVVAFQGWYTQNSGGLVKLETQTLESKIYQDTLQNKDFDARLGYRRADFDQASSFYNTLLCDSSQNFTNWCNPKYDALVLEANKTADATQRANLYAQANLLIQQQTPVDPLFVKSAYLLQSPALGGLSLAVKRRYLRDYFIIADKKVAPSN